MSDTPRTDEKITKVSHSKYSFARGYYSEVQDVVPADFARELERELSAKPYDTLTGEQRAEVHKFIKDGSFITADNAVHFLLKANDGLMRSLNSEKEERERANTPLWGDGHIND